MADRDQSRLKSSCTGIRAPVISSCDSADAKHCHRGRHPQEGSRPVGVVHDEKLLAIRPAASDCVIPRHAGKLARQRLTSDDLAGAAWHPGCRGAATRAIAFYTADGLGWGRLEADRAETLARKTLDRPTWAERRQYRTGFLTFTQLEHGVVVVWPNLCRRLLYVRSESPIAIFLSAGAGRKRNDGFRDKSMESCRRSARIRRVFSVPSRSF